MIPVYSSPRLHLANARTVLNGLQDGLLRVKDVTVLRSMLTDIRTAVFHTSVEGWVIVETWLRQATEILDGVIYHGRPYDDLDFATLKACLTEAACVLR